MCFNARSVRFKGPSWPAPRTEMTRDRGERLFVVVVVVDAAVSCGSRLYMNRIRE